MEECANFAVTAALSAKGAGAAAAQKRIQVGRFTCGIAGRIGSVFGPQQTLNCTFTPSVAGPAEFSAGTLTGLGVDSGVTDRRMMVWLGMR
jgi:hypothetical protein